MVLRALLAVCLAPVAAVLITPTGAAAAEAAPSADLAVTKEMSPSDPVPGSEVTFTITVGSAGPDTATNVVLADQLDAGLSQVTAAADNGGACEVAPDRLLLCRLGDIEATGDVVTVTVTATLAADFTDTLANTASVDSDVDDPDPGNDTATVTGEPSAVADLSVTTELSPAAPVPGGPVTWTITIDDAGPSTAADVTLADPLDPALTDVEVTTSDGTCEVVDGTLGCDLGDIAPDDEPVVVTAGGVLDPAFTGTLTNTATVSSPTSDPVVGNNTDSTTADAAPSADLSIVKAVTPAVPVPGGPVRFTLAVDNDGPSTATDVTATDELPDGLSGIIASSDTGTCEPVGDDRVVRCHLGTVAAADDPVVVTITATLALDFTGPLSNSASVSSATPDPDPSDNDSMVSGESGRSADLSVVTTADVEQAVAGTGITWTVTVRNDGPSTSADVVLRDLLPDGIEVGAVTTGAGTCEAVDRGGLLRCDLGDLAPGAIVTVTVTATVAPDADGVLENTAAVVSPTADPDTDDRGGAVAVPVVARADLHLTKQASDATARVGDVVRYTLGAGSRGPSTAVDVVVSDDLPSGVDLVGTPETDTGSCVVADRAVTCTLGDLVPGDTAVVTLTTRVTAGAEGATVTNSAAVGSVTGELVPDDNTDAASIAVAAASGPAPAPETPGSPAPPGPPGPGAGGPTLAQTGADLPLAVLLGLAMTVAGAVLTSGARLLGAGTRTRVARPNRRAPGADPPGGRVRSLREGLAAGVDEGPRDVLGRHDATVDRDRGPAVHLADRGVPQEVPHVRGTDASGRQHDDPAGGLTLEGGEPRGALGGRAGSAGGEHPVDAEPDERLEGGRQVGRLVERAVEGHGGPTGRRDEPRGDLLVDPPLAGQRPDDDADRHGGRESAQRRDVGEHHGDLGLVVDEVTATGADEHLDPDPGGQGEHRGDRADARGHPSDGEVGAQLDPVGTRALGREGTRDVVDAHLDEDAVGLGAHPAIVARLPPAGPDGPAEPRSADVVDVSPRRLA